MSTPEKADDRQQTAGVKSEEQEELTGKVKELVALGDEKEIALYDQQRISDEIVGQKTAWYKLDEEDAKEVFTNLKLNGHTFWLNRATGQTDIADVTTLSHEQEDRTEIIYVDDEPYEITPQKRQAYEFHDQEMKLGWLKASFHLAVILESGLYKVGGYNNQEEFAKFHLGESRRNMLRKARRGRRVLSMLPDVTSMSQIESGDYNDYLENIAEIGPTKFNEIIKFDDGDFDLEEFAKAGEATLPSGETISIEDIKSQTVKQVSQQMQAERKKLQGRIANLEEDKKKYREERDHYKGQLESEQDRIERSKDIEEKFGKQAARMEEVDYLLDKTEEGLKEIENSFGKVEVDFSDPEALRERVMTLLRRMTLVQEAALTRYGWLQDMDELSLFPAHKLADGKGEKANVEV